MAFYTTLFGHVELPEPRDGSDGRPQGRPTGVRTVRRRPPPRAAGGARSPRCPSSTRPARSH